MFFRLHGDLEIVVMPRDSIAVLWGTKTAKSQALGRSINEGSILGGSGIDSQSWADNAEIWWKYRLY